MYSADFSAANVSASPQPVGNAPKTGHAIQCDISYVDLIIVEVQPLCTYTGPKLHTCRRFHLHEQREERLACMNPRYSILESRDCNMVAIRFEPTPVMSCHAGDFWISCQRNFHNKATSAVLPFHSRAYNYRHKTIVHSPFDKP